MAVKSLDTLDLKGKRVLLRVDYNVPMDQNGIITEDTRIRASLPTLEALLAMGCSVTLMSHLGRPGGKVDPRYSMAPVAVRLAELLNREVDLVEQFGDQSHQSTIQMLENLRFSSGETKNDEGFAELLSRHGDVYINDAFGAAHRAHASIDAVCRFFQVRGAGLLMMKELRYLSDSLKSPERPFSAVLGGSKVSDKLLLIENLLGRIDRLIIGGGMSYTFLKAMGIPVGKSLVEEGFVRESKALIDRCKELGVALYLPLDHLCGESFAEDTHAVITLEQEIEPDYMGLDIGPETINLFTTQIKSSKTVVWNGPMGVFEWDVFSTGTISVAEAMAEMEGLTIVGGGDSVAAVNRAGVAQAMTHISTGGGASLELLGGAILPGIAALES